MPVYIYYATTIPIPTVNWEEWQLVAILLIVIGALFWRFEKIINRKDDAQVLQRETFAKAIESLSQDNRLTMKDFSSAMHELTESVREGDREIVERLIIHDSRVAAIAQALAVKEELTPQEVERIFDRIRRERP